jgi:putative DNA primase/helicase
MGKWPGILSALGVDEKFLGRKHTCCPFCGGRDRFRFDDKNGTGSFFCSQCGAGGGMEFVMRFMGCSFKDAAAEVDRLVGTVKESIIITERSEADKVASIKKVLQGCRAVVRGDPVWRYLNRRTGVEDVPPDIKYHPGLYHTDGATNQTFPVMVSVIRAPDGTGLTLHRTYLTLDGQKASVEPAKKMMPGKRLNGGAVRLSLVQEVLGLAEGIENALEACRRFSVPVWAATNAVLLEQFVPPEGVRKLIVFGDLDSSFTGQAAAYSLAKRLHREKYEVEVVLPDQVDKDWCDLRQP